MDDSKPVWLLVLFVAGVALCSTIHVRKELRHVKAELGEKTQQVETLERALATRQVRVAELGDTLERAITNERSLKEAEDRIAELEQDLRRRDLGLQQWQDRLVDSSRRIEAESREPQRFYRTSNDLIQEMQMQQVQNANDVLEEMRARQTDHGLYDASLEDRIEGLESQLRELNREHLWQECDTDRPEREYHPVIPPSMVNPAPSPDFSIRDVGNMSAKEWIKAYHQHQIEMARHPRPPGR